MDSEKLRKASIIIRGAADEANTIATYIDALLQLGDGDDLREEYAEIISDELNHIIRFTQLASEVSGIEIAED